MSAGAVTARVAPREHLAAIANQPRAAGSDAERVARQYVAAELVDGGFSVSEEPFEFSRFPACYGLPIIGAYVTSQLLIGASIGLLGDSPFHVITALFVLAPAWLLTGNGVLTFPYFRATATNLIATRGTAEPKVWLVAHLDTKSQPVPTLVRMFAIVTLSIALVLFVTGLFLTLMHVSPRMVWWAVIVTSVAGGIPVMASVVRNKSNGALDNASGVAAVLGATALVQSERIGVLITSAEELGLAGVRAWSRNRGPGIALNCDGIDDRGQFLMMYNVEPPRRIVKAIQSATSDPIAVRQMPLGILTDSTALAQKGWQSVTLSRGDLRTLGRVHSRSDTLANLAGNHIGEAARILARSAEELAS